MKITSIKQQVKYPDRVSVFVDNNYQFSLSLDELVKYKLKNGQQLSKADIKKFIKISTDGKQRARALEWLLNRPHSEREFRNYLFRKKVEPDQIESLVTEFSGKGYLDNAKFAAWFADVLTRRNKSDRQIRAELFKKGIESNIVAEIIDNDEIDEAVRLNTLITKKSKLTRYQKDPQKLARYLVGQGFSWQAVMQALADNSSDTNT